MAEQPTGTDTGRTSRRSCLGSGSHFTRPERHEIFKRMVAEELKKGALPYRRRRKLMQYASQVDIRPFDASLLIAEAQLEAGQLDFIDPQPAEPMTSLIHPERWPIWFKMTIGLIIVALLDITILRLLGW
jgi:hypothetical protein